MQSRHKPQFFDTTRIMPLVERHRAAPGDPDLRNQLTEEFMRPTGWRIRSDHDAVTYALEVMSHQPKDSFLFTLAGTAALHHVNDIAPAAATGYIGEVVLRARGTELGTAASEKYEAYTGRGQLAAVAPPARPQFTGRAPAPLRLPARHG